jgi:thiol-disulfide isomerase/thioredoxin
MLRVRTLGAVLISALAVLAAGCGSPAAQGQDQSQGQAPVPAAPPAAPGSSANAAAPVNVPEELKFAAKTLDGKDFAGESLAGRSTVLWFWTPWCARCQGESANMARFAKEHAATVTFVGVAAQDQVSAMQAFVTKRGVQGFTHLNDKDSAIWKRFGIIEQPSYAFIHPDGTVEVSKRQLSENEMASRLRILSEA